MKKRKEGNVFKNEDVAKNIMNRSEKEKAEFGLV